MLQGKYMNCFDGMDNAEPYKNVAFKHVNPGCSSVIAIYPRNEMLYFVTKAWE